MNYNEYWIGCNWFIKIIDPNSPRLCLPLLTLLELWLAAMQSIIPNLSLYCFAVKMQPSEIYIIYEKW